MVDENKIIINDKLLEYYTLKNEYEQTYYQKHVKPIVMSNYSNLTKRKKYQELSKPQCINCKQPVGTIFERKYYNEYGDKREVIVFTAKCGNLLNPCDLNIEIHKSLRENFDKLIEEHTRILNDYQMKIIKLKNKLLFLGKNKMDEQQYIDEFETYKKQILYHSETIGEYIEENILINDNPEEKTKLNNLISSLNQQEIMQFKDYIKQFMETNNENLLVSAVNMYVKEIIPKLEEIRNMKYKTMYVIHDAEHNHTLIQSKYSQEGMNFYDDYVDEVVHFIKGSKVESTKKSKIKVSQKTEEENIEKTSKKSKTLKSGKTSSKAKTQKKKLKITDKNINEEEQQNETVIEKKVKSIKYESEDEGEDEDETLFSEKSSINIDKDDETPFFESEKKVKSIKYESDDEGEDEDEGDKISFTVPEQKKSSINVDEDEVIIPTPSSQLKSKSKKNQSKSEIIEDNDLENAPKPKKLVGKKIYMNAATEAM